MAAREQIRNTTLNILNRESQAPTDQNTICSAPMCTTSAVGTSVPSPNGKPKAPDRVRTSSINALQRSVGNASTTRMINSILRTTHIQRAGASGGIQPKIWIESPEVDLAKFGSATSYVKGDIKAKFEGTAEFYPRGSSPEVQTGLTLPMGIKADFNLGKQVDLPAVLKALRVESVKEKIGFELSKKRFDVSGGVEATISLPWKNIKGSAELKFVVVGVEWAKIAEDLDNVTVGGIKGSGGISVETDEMTLPNTDNYVFKLKGKVNVTGTVKPNMARIAAEAAKQAATGAAKGTAEGVAEVAAETAAAGAGEAGGGALVVDAGALASSAAAIALPLAFAAIAGYSLYRSAYDVQAAQLAAGTGVQAREQAIEHTKNFANVLVGGKGVGPGAQEAETQISNIMTRTGASREQVIEALIKEQGGHNAIYEKNLKCIKDKLFADAVAAFDASHKDDFGIIESLGEEWGMRGVYRRILRTVLYPEG